jgi:hypothetical protein
MERSLDSLGEPVSRMTGASLSRKMQKPLNRVRYHITEMEDKERLIESRIKYLKNREDKILKKLSKEQLLFDIALDAVTERTRKNHQMDAIVENKTVIDTLQKDYKQRQRVDVQDTIQEKKVNLRMHNHDSAQ